MQGIQQWIPTDTKVEYLKSLLQVGFPVLDFGSFVNPKAIPQMADTAQVLKEILPHKGTTKLLAIVANKRGATNALYAGGVDILGFPLSVSEQFQQLNTGKSISEALDELEAITTLARAEGVAVTAYLSMAFGNPYNENINPLRLQEHTERLRSMGIGHIALADTVGKADADAVGNVYKKMATDFPDLIWICHLHAKAGKAAELAAAAHANGCVHFDTALGGFGGCPLSGDALLGNLDTMELIAFAHDNGLKNNLNLEALSAAQLLANTIFTKQA